MADHWVTWMRLRELARERFPDDDLAAKIAAREAFDAEETTAYAADLDAQVEEQGACGHASLRGGPRCRWQQGRR
jgi:hypothetical protein